jgi:PAS domain-containing protein
MRLMLYIKHALGHVSTWSILLTLGAVVGVEVLFRMGISMMPPLMSPLRTTTGGGVVAHTDITERKRAEMAVRHSEQRLRSLVHNVSDRIAVVDAMGIIRSESPGVERQLGYTPEELMGTNGFSLLYADD